MSNKMKDVLSCERLRYSEKMIGKRVFVVSDGGWYGTVMDVRGWDTFIVKSSRDVDEVNIFDIRSIGEYAPSNVGNTKVAL